MSDLLPVVQKAQPFQVNWSYQTLDAPTNPSLNEVAVWKDIERERAGYKKREQQLKNKIRKYFAINSKLAKIWEEWRDEEWTGEMEEYWEMKREPLTKLQKELLGLSKQ